jgi:hypothetical protein
MAADSRPGPVAAADTSVTGKEIDVTGSLSGSDIAGEVQKTGKGYREGETFVTKGLRHDAYRPVDTYEGLHRYDPEFEWEHEEERKVVRKVR